MSAPTDTTSELMTEHLQYAPLTLIDDVINSANAILYQAMDAFETYLRDTLIPSIPSSTKPTKTFALDAPEDPERDALYKELEFGMAQVETLLENAVDRNFDAFELYVLRNVFNVPDDVDGYLRLAHHQVRSVYTMFTTRDWISRQLQNTIRNWIQQYTLHERGSKRFVPSYGVLMAKANKMTALLQREKAKNETHLQPLRENARKLAFLYEATKSNDGKFSMT